MSEHHDLSGSAGRRPALSRRAAGPGGQQPAELFAQAARRRRGEHAGGGRQVESGPCRAVHGARGHLRSEESALVVGGTEAGRGTSGALPGKTTSAVRPCTTYTAGVENVRRAERARAEICARRNTACKTHTRTLAQTHEHMYTHVRHHESCASQPHVYFVDKCRLLQIITVQQGIFIGQGTRPRYSLSGSGGPYLSQFVGQEWLRPTEVAKFPGDEICWERAEDSLPCAANGVRIQY